ncbi:MAG: 4a-hydroxytetrahydrobiopterin dehydratase [Rhodothermales bacterium]
MPAEPLTQEQIDEALRDLEGWRFEDDQLKKSFELKDFRAAVSFIVRMAFYAEAMNHHPDVHNVYNKIDLALTTHDAGDKVTEKDVQLARAIEDFSWV